jgi:hypothetical protein
MGCSSSVAASPQAARYGDDAEAAMLSDYCGDAFIARDQTAFLFDWDDTLFPTAWMMEDVGESDTFDRARLQRLAEVRKHFETLVQLICTASKLGHVFIVTAAHRNFVRKTCGVLFRSWWL